MTFLIAAISVHPDTSGINQVGCVYAAQSFELDCVAAVGRNLRWHCAANDWILDDPSHSCDPTIVERAYRALNSRGLEGC